MIGISSRPTPSSIVARTASCGSAPNVTVNVVSPGAMCGDRQNQFDLRLGKVLRFGGTQTKVNFDLNNVFNAYPVLTENVSFMFSPAASILPARIARIGADRFLILPRHYPGAAADKP